MGVDYAPNASQTGSNCSPEAQPRPQPGAHASAEVLGHLVVGEIENGPLRSLEGEEIHPRGVHLFAVAASVGERHRTGLPPGDRRQRDSDSDRSGEEVAAPGKTQVGCGNGSFASGAKLAANGTANITGDTVRLSTRHLEPNNVGP